MTRWQECPDSELLLAARTCPEAFGVFYERHFAAVFAFFRRRVPGAEEAFDLAAETFAAALGSVPRYQPGREPAQAWLFAIGRHKLSEAIRTNRIQDEGRRALAMEPIHLDDEAIEILERIASGPALELLEPSQTGSARQSRRTTSTSAPIPRSRLSSAVRRASSASE